MKLKKCFSLLLALCMVLSISACGSANSNAEGTEKVEETEKTSAEVIEEAPEEAPEKEPEEPEQAEVPEPEEEEPAIPAYMTAERDYSTLPDALTFSDGTAVSSTEDFELRREEILSLFAENVYGSIPADGYDADFTIIEQGEALDGAAIRKQINISVSTEKGSSDALMVLYLPADVEKAPVVLGLFMSGVHTILDDPEIISSYTYPKTGEELDAERGLAASRWQIEEAISRGYGVAVIYTNDFAPDNEEEYATRLISLFDDPEFKTISAWAFGLMRAVDYLETDENVDASKIVLVGHSRCGKAALWAGANDERVALTISNESGTGGATLNRSICGETIGDITTSFPYWFCSNFASYAGREDELPVDQNLLLASFAPRMVYVAVASGDESGDPIGAWNSLINSLDAFELYGLETVDASLFDGKDFVGPISSFSESTGFHLREGSHNIGEEDWAFYFDYMDEYLK